MCMPLSFFISYQTFSQDLLCATGNECKETDISQHGPPKGKGCGLGIEERKEGKEGQERAHADLPTVLGGPGEG